MCDTWLLCNQNSILESLQAVLVLETKPGGARDQNQYFHLIHINFLFTETRHHDVQYHFANKLWSCFPY